MSRREFTPKPKTRVKRRKDLSSSEIMKMRLVLTFAAAFVHMSSGQKAVDSLMAMSEFTPTPQPPLPLVTEPTFHVAQSFLPDNWHTIAHQQWAERRLIAKVRNQTRTPRGVMDFLPPFCTSKKERKEERERKKRKNAAGCHSSPGII